MLRKSLKNCAAFTLVEVLVVIAIISILAAFLLPTLNRAVEQSRRIKCMGQLMQVGLASFHYVSDCNRFIPSDGHDLLRLRDGSSFAPGAHDSFAQYLEGTLTVFYCPNNNKTRTPSDWPDYIGYGYLANPVERLDKRRQPYMVKPGRNGRILPSHAGSCSPSDYAPSRVALAVDIFKRDNTLTMFMDLSHTADTPDGVNALMGDGHVEWRAYPELKLGFAYDGNGRFFW